MLIIVCGLPGTGKTTVAKIISSKTKSVLLRADVIRKELIKKPKYTEEEKQNIYNEMFFRAQALLRKNRNVVLDATFTKKQNRDQVKKITEAENTNLKVVEIVCTEDIVERKIQERLEDESDAQFETYLKYKKLFEPIKEKHIIINNSGTLKKTNEQINEYF